MRRLFLDTSPLLFAVGQEHRHKAAGMALLAAAQEARIEIHIAAETVQEYVFHRLRRVSRQDAVDEARDLRALCVSHPLDEDVLDRGLRLLQTSDLRGRDAFIAAAGLCAGFDHIVSVDSDFDGIPGLQRIPPTDAVAI